MRLINKILLGATIISATLGMTSCNKNELNNDVAVENKLDLAMDLQIKEACNLTRGILNNTIDYYRVPVYEPALGLNGEAIINSTKEGLYLYNSFELSEYQGNGTGICNRLVGSDKTLYTYFQNGHAKTSKSTYVEVAFPEEMHKYIVSELNEYDRGVFNTNDILNAPLDLLEGRGAVDEGALPHNVVVKYNNNSFLTTIDIFCEGVPFAFIETDLSNFINYSIRKKNSYLSYKFVFDNRLNSSILAMKKIKPTLVLENTTMEEIENQYNEVKAKVVDLLKAKVIE